MLKKDLIAENERLKKQLGERRKLHKAVDAVIDAPSDVVSATTSTAKKLWRKVPKFKIIRA